MNNTVNPEKLRKAKIASCCFMGLGQILFLKQYIRGALYALVEVAMICAIVIGTKGIIPGNRKEAAYIENARPEYKEMVKYFNSDEAESCKGDADAIINKGADAFKNIVDSNKQFLEEHSVLVFEDGEIEDSVEENAIKGVLRDFVSKNSESLEKHNFYLSDELAKVLSESDESLSDYIDGYEIDADKVEELKETFSSNEAVVALMNKFQEKIDNDIFVAQIDIEDFETAQESIEDILDSYLESVDGETDEAFDAYVEVLKSMLPNVIKIDYKDITALDIAVNSLVCLPWEDESSFEAEKEALIGALDENLNKTSKRLAKLMAKQGMKNYAEHKHEYESKYDVYEASVKNVLDNAKKEIAEINSVISNLNGKIKEIPNYYDDVTALNVKIENLSEVKQFNEDGTENLSAIEVMDTIKTKYAECISKINELTEIAKNKDSKIDSVRKAEAEVQTNFSELEDLFVKYANACEKIDLRNAAKEALDNDADKIANKIAELKKNLDDLKKTKEDNDNIDTNIENLKRWIDAKKELARGLIALYKVDYTKVYDNKDDAVKSISDELTSIYDAFFSNIEVCLNIEGISESSLAVTKEQFFSTIVKRDLTDVSDAANAIYENCRPTNPNAFDLNYDGCISCKMSNDKGIRTTTHMAWGHGPIVSSLEGLFSLGHKTDIYPDTPDTPMKYRDHSIFMMINGIFALIFILFFVILYAMNIGSANASAEKIIKNGRFPTWQESKNDVSQNSFATIGISPSIIMICVFSIIPLLFSALIAFTNYSSPDYIPPNNLVEWVGLGSFVQMFSTTGVGGGSNAWAASFGWAAGWTIVWAVFATFTCFFVGFFYAFVLQDKRIIIPHFFRTVFILPYAIPTMLSLFIWANLLNGTIGPINELLKMLGFGSVRWLSDPWIAKGTLIFVNIWIGFPYSMILTTSSMTAISNSLYEAAVIDGATKWQQFKNITYPLVMFQLKPTLIMQFAGNINNFGAVFFLSGGGPNLPGVGLTSSTSCGATDILISWIYKLTMNTPYRYNLASVLSLLVFVVLVPFALYNFTRTKSFKEGAV